MIKFLGSLFNKEPCEEKEIADRVRAAAKEWNSTIQQARKAGLNVETVVKNWTSTRYYTPITIHDLSIYRRTTTEEDF